MPVNLEKANEVINFGFDVFLEELRNKAADKNSHLRISDTTAAVNSAIGAMRQVYSEKSLQLRIITMLSPKQQKTFLPSLIPDLKMIEAGKGK